ncbi:MAG: hypothetical protein PHV59_07970 [Victivallales bacterium]|nr:hypothetical protein [Victivallales bacterium]
MRKLFVLFVAAIAFAMVADVRAAESGSQKTAAPAAAGKVVAKQQARSNAQKTPAPAVATAKSKEKWDFIQPCFWFGVPTSTATTDVYGVKVGAPFCSGTGVVTGVETAVICGATDNINGLQACIIFSKSKRINGVQFSIVNYCEEVNGLQLGVVNVAKSKAFQLGIVNYIEENTFPWMPVFNCRF